MQALAEHVTMAMYFIRIRALPDVLKGCIMQLESVKVLILLSEETHNDSIRLCDRMQIM